MFRKVAKFRSIASAEMHSRGGRFVLEASRRVTASQGRMPSADSWYLDGARDIPVSEILRSVSAQYAISADPRDYVYEVIRANTTNIPNENNDGFHQSELLRFDTRLAMPVYRTYEKKPHHIDHRASNPLAARGVILDAHYNNSAPALSRCTRCRAELKRTAHFDPTGIHCRRCGSVSRDEFVEVLLAVDARKDPDLAMGVRTGAMGAASMGCSCYATGCNVCANVAYSKSEFCAHVKLGNKGTLWTRQRADLPWNKSSMREIEARAQKLGYDFDWSDFTYLLGDDGFEARRAAEYCQLVVFDELSRVGEPADPKALQIEVFNRAAAAEAMVHTAALSWPTMPEGRTLTAAEISAETAALIHSIAAASAAAPHTRRASVEEQPSMKYIVVRINEDDADVHAGATLDEALAASGVSDPETQTESVDVCDVDATSPDEAAMLFDASRARPLAAVVTAQGAQATTAQPAARQAQVVIEAPPGQAVTIKPPGDEAAAMPGAPAGGPPGPTGPGALPPGPGAPAPQVPGAEDPEMTPSELGIVPPGASSHEATPIMASAAQRAGRFGKAYGSWKIRATSQGTLRLFTDKDVPLCVISSKGTGAKAVAHARAVQASLCDRGLVETIKLFGGHFAPNKVAQVVDGAINDIEGYDDHQMHDSVTTDGLTDIDAERAAPPSSTLDEAKEGDDIDDDAARRAPPKSTQDDITLDHDGEGEDSPPDSATEEGGSDMADDQRKPYKPGDSVLKGESHDFADSKKASTIASKVAAMTRLGTKVRHNARPDLVWTVSASMLEGGTVAVKVEAKGQAPRKVSQADLVRHWAAVSAPATSRPAQEVIAAAAASDLKLAQRKLALLERKMAAQEKNHAAELEATKFGVMKAFVRSMRLAASRRVAGLEGAPMRDAIEQAFAVPRLLSAGLEQVDYCGMDAGLARYLAHEVFANVAAPDLDSLVQRAAELMERGDNYLMDAESDARNFSASIPPLQLSQPIDGTARAAMQMRAQLLAGNFALNCPPTPTSALPMETGKQAHVANLVGHTRTATLAKAMRERIG